MNTHIWGSNLACGKGVISSPKTYLICNCSITVSNPNWSLKMSIGLLKETNGACFHSAREFSLYISQVPSILQPKKWHTSSLNLGFHLGGWHICREMKFLPSSTAVTPWFIYLGHFQFTGAFCQALRYRLTEASLICLFSYQRWAGLQL